MRNYIASLVLCCWITYCSAQKYYSAAENDFVSLVHNIENGEEKFPQTVVIEFEQRGVRHRFTLSRDDSSTALLSESVFHTSRSLPSDVYRDEDHENFAAYDGGSNFVLHRETNTSPLKVYGGFTKQGENMVVRAMDGLHRVVRASDLHRRQKRSANSFNREDLALNSSAQVIELFMFADLSIWDHFQNNDLLPGTSNEADKLVIRDYMESLTRDVDRVFNEEGYPGFRVYFMDYQVITQASHQQAWTTNNLNDPLLTEGAITDFVAYYDKLVNKFDFPEPDHIMMLTKYTLASQYYQSFLMCSGSTNRSVSIVGATDYVKGMVQAIAASLGDIQLDGPNGCNAADGYVMSQKYMTANPTSLRGNAWRFSSCTSTELRDVANSGNMTCLSQAAVDRYFEFDTYIASPTIGERYTRDLQCHLIYSKNHTFNNSHAANVEANCYSPKDRCVSGSGSSSFIRLGHLTPCSSTSSCQLGFCEELVYTTTTAAPEADSTSGAADTTKADTTIVPPITSTERPSTSTQYPSCVEEISFVDVDLPGCGCCGPCGCDEECDTCNPPMPSESFVNDTCVPRPGCCSGKLRVTTLFIPHDCPVHIAPGRQTIVYDQYGWEEIDVHAVALVTPLDRGYDVRLERIS